MHHSLVVYSHCGYAASASSYSVVSIFNLVVTGVFIIATIVIITFMKSMVTDVRIIVTTI